MTGPTAMCTDDNIEDVEDLDLRSLDFNIPSATSKVFKDECMYCFHTPLHPGGLYVCLKTFAGFCERHIKSYCEKYGQKAFVFLKHEKEPIETAAEEPQDKVTKLAIGVDGGFCSSPQYRTVESAYFVVYPDLSRKICFSRLTGGLSTACANVASSSGVRITDQLESGVSGWDGEAKIITKHANLQQLDNGVKVLSCGWKCQAEGCDLTENLWLNLTDGTIKCGRSQYISESVRTKGNNHMKEHFEKLKYPLVVKLGTISKGTADVYSYDEDDFVDDPNLRAHLLHFGVDVDALEKTEKSTLELELDLNKKWEWTMCSEDGANLELAFGPGLTGMVNIGSSCYINSSLQMLIQIPEVARAYGICAPDFFTKVSPIESHDDFNCQTAKVVSCLLSGDYSKKDGEFNAITPTQFKRVIGKGHPEFATCRQQDAEEYIRYFFSKMDDNLSADMNPVNAVRFRVENRFVDNASGGVRYDQSEDLLLSLTVPLPPGKQEVASGDADKLIRPTVTLSECLSATFAEQLIPEFRSPVTNEQLGARQSIRIATFPDFLVVQLKKFVLNENWTISKMDVNVVIDETIDLEAFRGKGQQPDEILLPDDAVSTVMEPMPEINQLHVETICGMGFSKAAARRALYETKNADVDTAVDWILQHLDDPDLNTEHPAFVPKHRSVDPSLVMQLAELGFTAHQAKYALKEQGGNLQSAADWLFVNVDKVPQEETSTSEANEGNYRDGSARYNLIGFISHMGSSPHSGHYVAHLKKGGIWYIFNDEKVAISQNPPSTLAYIYLYRRI